MTIDPTLLVLLSAIISSASALAAVMITNHYNMRTTRLTKESEERKHQKELVFKAAIENWKQTYELMKTSGLPNKMMAPLDVFLVHMVALSDAIFDPNLSADTLRARLAEVTRLTDIVESTIPDIQPRPPSS